MTDSVNNPYASQLSMLAATPSTGQTNSSNGGNSWFEAMANAWGQALDQQANVIQQDSSNISTAGNDQPSAITTLTAESLKMSFLANSSQSSISAVGQGLETMARKS
jgi:hypothetical protein